MNNELNLFYTLIQHFSIILLERDREIGATEADRYMAWILIKWTHS